GVAVGVTVGVLVGVAGLLGVLVGVGGPNPGESASCAPMEQFTWPVPGRTKARWSRFHTGPVAQMELSPALIAALPDWSAIVCVKPPLSASGESLGSPKEPTQLVSVLGQRKLWPPSVKLPPQLPPEVLLATMVLTTISVALL